MTEVEEFLRKKFDNLIERFELLAKEDLNLANHLSGLKRPVLKIYFRNVNDLTTVKRTLQPIILKNNIHQKTDSVYEYLKDTKTKIKELNYSELILDIREHDIPFHLRVAIDYGNDSVFA